MYAPLEIVGYDVVGIGWAIRAMRLPKMSKGDSPPRCPNTIGQKDLHLASNLVKAGDDHSKAIRGIIVYMEIKFQAGFMIEFETYRHGIECLSTSSSMHMELSGLSGAELAEQKQADLSTKVYTRILTASYQALRHMYHARRHHRHPDWQVMCDFVETLPYAAELICVESYRSREASKWKDLVYQIADALHCLPSSSPEGNGHLFRVIAELKADAGIGG